MTFHSFLLIDVFLYIVVIPCIVYFFGVLFYEAVANDKFKIASTKTNYNGAYQAPRDKNPWQIDNPYSNGKEDIRWLL